MASPYFAEFLGTLVFLCIILLVVYWLVGFASNFVVALLIGLGLFLGIWICLSLSGPGFLNPAVAIQNGVIGDKGASYIFTMILVELFAVVIALALYYFIVGSWSTKSSMAAAKTSVE